MGKKREQEERGRRKGENPKKGKGAVAETDVAQAEGSTTTTSVVSTKQFNGRMIVVVCSTVSGRIIASGLAAGQAWANPKRDNGHRCTACGKDVAAGHSVVRGA